MIFSGPLQPPLLGAGIASARVHLSPEIRDRQVRLMERIRLFNALAAARGIPLGFATETPIRFVRIGDEAATYRTEMNWLAQQENLISIRPKSPDDRRVTLTDDQLSMVMLFSIVLLPGLVIAAGVFSWWRRRG